MTRRFLPVVLVCLVVAVRALSAQQDIPPDKVRIADAVRTDLSKLSDLERSYFAANKKYTTDTKALHFEPASGASISVSYASARTFSASASHVRLAPFLCFVIVSSVDAGSPAEKPFCTDSRYGTAATALAQAGTDLDAPARGTPSRPASSSVMPVTIPETPHAATQSGPAPAIAATRTITPAEFAERLRRGAEFKGDSVGVVVHFAVKDARYDPSRGVLEISIERVPLPLVGVQGVDSTQARLALSCFTRPAFVCGLSGLTYFARDLLHVPRARAPGPEVMRSGLTLDAQFAIGRRDDSAGPALTLLALLLQANGEVVSRWDATVSH